MFKNLLKNALSVWKPSTNVYFHQNQLKNHAKNSYVYCFLLENYKKHCMFIEIYGKNRKKTMITERLLKTQEQYGNIV